MGTLVQKLILFFLSESIPITHFKLQFKGSQNIKFGT